MMVLPQSFLLAVLLGGFSKALLGAGVVYYVRPAEFPSSDCPGEPCKTLQYYVKHSNRYFNSDKINITMIFLHGDHIITDQNYFKLTNFTTFRMIGLELASDVVVHVDLELQMCTWNSIDELYIEAITFVATNDFAHFQLPGNHVSIIETAFNGVSIYFNQDFNYSIAMINSTFTNGADINHIYKLIKKNDTYNRFWNVVGCAFNNVSLSIGYDRTEIIIKDSTFTNMKGCSATIYVQDSAVMIAGNVYFSSPTCTPAGALIAFSSNVTIVGNILFSKHHQPAITAHFSNITIAGKVTFVEHQWSAIIVHSSVITLSGNVSFLNNSGAKGGAMALYLSTLNIDKSSNIYFYKNSAVETGGALYVEVDQERHLVYCFYQLLGYVNGSSHYAIHFQNNSAERGGDHIYGEYMHSDACIVALGDDGDKVESFDVQKYFSYDPGFNSSLSPVSSDPQRVCFCHHGRPKCKDNDIKRIKVYPGETFTLSAVIVGADFGTTVGTVYAIPNHKLANPASSAEPSNQYAQLITSNTVCSDLNYSVFTARGQEAMYLSVMNLPLTTVEKDYYDATHPYNYGIDSVRGSRHFIKKEFLTQPLLILSLIHI